MTAIELDGAILGNNKTKVPFTDIVKIFEQTLNIALGEPRDIKRKILRRNTKKTVFLDRLRARLSNDEF